MHNYSLAFFRFLSVIIVILFFSKGGEAFTFKVYSSYLIAHYALALVYFLNFKAIAQKGSQHFLGLGILFLFSFYLVRFQPIHILIYFGIHFYLTELYLTRFLGIEEDLKTKMIRTPFLIFSYLFFIKNFFTMSHYNTNILFGLVCFSFLLILAWNIIYKQKIWYEIGLFQGALVCWVMKLDMPLYFIIFYHIILWSFLPFIKYGFKKGATLVLMQLGIFSFTFYLGFQDDLFLDRVRCFPGICIGFFAFLHITMSFGTSRLNPRFVQNILGYSK